MVSSEVDHTITVDLPEFVFNQLARWADLHSQSVQHHVYMVLREEAVRIMRGDYDKALKEAEGA